MRDSHLTFDDAMSTPRKIIPSVAKPSLPKWYILSLVVAISVAIGSFFVLNHPFNMAKDILWKLKSPDQTDFLSRAKHLLRSTPLVDGHNDFPFVLRSELRNQIYGLDFQNLHLASHTDLFKMRQGMLGGQFWSVWVPCPAQLNGNDSMVNFTHPASGQRKVLEIDEATWAVRDTLEQIDVTKRLIAQYPDRLEFCSDPACVRKVHKTGRVASMIGIEGGHQTGNSLGALRQLFDLGARYITLTHNCDNAVGTAWSSVHMAMKTAGQINLDVREVDPGLTAFGRDFVHEMNRLGMLVDLSHVSANTMRDVLSTTRAPVIFSHSGACAMENHGRNVPDDVLLAVKKNGGVVMVPVIAQFLNAQNPEEATVEDVVDHILHIAKVAGWKNVGIGSDFDGSTMVPEGIEDIAQYPNLIARVLARGVSDDNAKLLIGNNILRVWEEAQQIAQRLQDGGEQPSEGYYEGRQWDATYANQVPNMFPKTNEG